MSELTVKYENEETFPFICKKCYLTLECDVAMNGKCVCCFCDKEIYDKYHKDNKMAIVEKE